MKIKSAVVTCIFTLFFMSVNVFAANPTVSVAGSYDTQKNFTMEIDFGSTEMYTEGTVNLLLVDGDIVPNVDATIEYGTTMVPLRVVSDRLGVSTTWDPVSKSINLYKDNTNIEMFINKNYMYINGMSIKIARAPEIIRSTTFVPIRAISEAFNADVGFVPVCTYGTGINIVYVDTKKEVPSINEQDAINITTDTYFNKFLPEMYDYVQEFCGVNIEGMNAYNVNSFVNYYPRGSEGSLPYMFYDYNPCVYADMGEYYYVRLFNDGPEGCLVDKYDGSYFPISSFSLGFLNITRGDDFGSWGLNYQ